MMEPILAGAVAGLLLFAILPAPAENPLSVKSEAFSLVVDSGTARGMVWQNRLAHTRLELGGGPEVEVGDSPESARRVALGMADPSEQTPRSAHAMLHLRAADSTLDIAVHYSADANWPILHKVVEVTNTSGKPLRLLNVVLGRYPLGKAKAEGGERGFPLYLNQSFFLSLAHPAGFAHLEGQEVVLRQYPGVLLAPGQTFRSMEALYGVAGHGRARKLFVDYVRSRMARVVYGHDHPYSILESFGGQPEGNFKTNYEIGVSESYLLRHLEQVAASRRDSGVQFDFYGLEFWHERADYLKEFSRANFPNGFRAVRDHILDLGMKPGLWIDSGGLPPWTIDRNPAVAGCRTVREGEGSFCRASEPIDQIYKEGFTYQMRENRVGLLKFDNLAAVCTNPAHNHLPGPLYSTEAIYNGVIDFLTTLRRANPDVFIMLYWGYRSPWWLLYGDTYFECGDQIEAASPAQYPAPYARDSVTQRLDQAQMRITDTPWLGKDSLGVWLSDWTWNSGIGKDRWQEGVIMDMARGGLLFQMWTDADWLTPPERAQVATFIDLMKANPGCFRHSRLFLGNPNESGPYGYCCSDGKRAFLSIHNACLKDSSVHLRFGPECDLPRDRQWAVYRWYPRPARLGADANEMTIAMRPYEVDLLEVVPAGEAPSLGRAFPEVSPTASFTEKTVLLPMEIAVQPAATSPVCTWQRAGMAHAESAKGATLRVLRDGSILATGPNVDYDSCKVALRTSAMSVTGLLVEVLTDDSLPAHGPGRAVNGNLALTGIRLTVGPKDRSGPAREVRFRSAAADFEQTSYGGWPAAAAIDGDPKTGWSIHPQVGMPHALVLALEQPLRLSPDTELILTLIGGQNGHNLGRFRVSVTSDERPSLPLDYQPGTATITCHLPATRTGGLLLLTGGSAEDAPQAIVAGQQIPLRSVWAAQSNWSCPWTAWRGEIGPEERERMVQIRLSRTMARAGARYSAYFLPR